MAISRAVLIDGNASIGVRGTARVTRVTGMTPCEMRSRLRLAWSTDPLLLKLIPGNLLLNQELLALYFIGLAANFIVSWCAFARSNLRDLQLMRHCET
jgi:hypothetical protein